MKLRYVRAPGVRSFFKERGLRTSAGFLESLDREVCEMLVKYQVMAKADRRRTVLACDISLPGVIAKLSRGMRR